MGINKTRLLYVHYNFILPKAILTTGKHKCTKQNNISMLEDDETSNLQIKFMHTCSIFSWQFAHIRSCKKNHFIMLCTLRISVRNLICKYFQDFTIFSWNFFLWMFTSRFLAFTFLMFFSPFLLNRCIKAQIKDIKIQLDHYFYFISSKSNCSLEDICLEKRHLSYLPGGGGARHRETYW